MPLQVVSTFYVYLKDPSAVDESAIAKELFNPKVFLSVVPVGTFEGPGPVSLEPIAYATAITVCAGPAVAWLCHGQPAATLS